MWPLLCSWELFHIEGQGCFLGVLMKSIWKQVSFPCKRMKHIKEIPATSLQMREVNIPPCDAREYLFHIYHWILKSSFTLTNTFFLNPESKRNCFELWRCISQSVMYLSSMVNSVQIPNIGIEAEQSDISLEPQCWGTSTDGISGAQWTANQAEMMSYKFTERLCLKNKS